MNHSSSKNNLVLGIIIAVLIFLIISVMAIFVFIYQNNSKTEQTTILNDISNDVLDLAKKTIIETDKYLDGDIKQFTAIENIYTYWGKINNSMSTNDDLEINKKVGLIYSSIYFYSSINPTESNPTISDIKEARNDLAELIGVKNRK